MAGKRRKKPAEEDGRTLFDEPLVLPAYEPQELVNTDTFLHDALYTSGLVMKVNRQLMEQVAAGKPPNYGLSKYLAEVTRNVNLSVSSYQRLLEIQEHRSSQDDAPELTFIS